MPKPPLPHELDQFLLGPNPSVIATLQEDGRPHSTPTWYLWESGRVLVNMDESRKRLAYLRREPHISLTVLGKDEWYRHVTLQGRVVSFDPDPELSDIDRLSRHYTGQPYARREQARVSSWIEVDWWHSWVGGHPWTGSD